MRLVRLVVVNKDQVSIWLRGAVHTTLVCRRGQRSTRVVILDVGHVASVLSFAIALTKPH